MIRALAYAAASAACRRRPRYAWQARVMLAAARLVAGFTDWAAYRATMVVAELEDLEGPP